MKKLVKFAILLALAAQVGLGVTYVSASAGEAQPAALCTRNASNGCDNNGCEGTGGVCGRAFADPKGGGQGLLASPCWCLY